MRIENDSQTVENIWANATGRAERNPVYDDIATLPEGVTAVLESGVDIPQMDDLNIYRKRLIGALRWRGVKVMTRVDGPILYVKVTGREERSNGAAH